jgi:hypothetical protein
LRARIHHHNAVTVAQQEFAVARISGAVVSDAMEKQNPISVGSGGAHFPAA